MTNIPEDIRKAAEAAYQAANSYVGWDDGVACIAEAILSERTASSRRSYELADAIMGGESVPGQADSVDTAELIEALRKERAERNAWTDACVTFERERSFKAGWNRAGGDYRQQESYHRWLGENT